MNRLISATIAVVTVLLAVFTFSLSLSPDWSVQRRVFINAKPHMVEKYVNNTAAWKNWNLWADKTGVSEVKMARTGDGTYEYLITSKETGLTQKSTVIVTGAEFGAYVIERVEGTSKSSPLTRYLLLLHNNVFGEELASDLTGLKRAVERK